jgi:cellulose synthase/poly-beta-1,6-N-acetylglucosamine synthase-like glycosyltransferase
MIYRMIENKKLPLVSVVITSKNEHKTIERCMMSILDQNYPSFEIIYIDAKSSDGTFEIAEKLRNLLDSRIKCIRYKAVSIDVPSPGRGRNLGVKMAEGSVIAFTDGDCVAKPDWLINSVRALSVEIGMVGGPNIIKHFKNSDITKAIDLVTPTYLGSGGSPQFYKINRETEVYAVPCCNMVVKRSLFENVGGFNEKLRYNEDSDLCIRIRKKGYKIIYNPKAIIYHFSGIDSYKDFVSFCNRYGFQRGNNAATNLELFTKFNALSLIVIITIASLLILSFIHSTFAIILLSLIGVIVLMFVVITLIVGIRNNRLKSFFFILSIFPTLHISYTCSFILGYLNGFKTSIIHKDLSSEINSDKLQN